MFIINSIISYHNTLGHGLFEIFTGDVSLRIVSQTFASCSGLAWAQFVHNFRVSWLNDLLAACVHCFEPTLKAFSWKHITVLWVFIFSTFCLELVFTFRCLWKMVACLRYLVDLISGYIWGYEQSELNENKLDVQSTASLRRILLWTNWEAWISKRTL